MAKKLLFFCSYLLYSVVSVSATQLPKSYVFCVGVCAVCNFTNNSFHLCVVFLIIWLVNTKYLFLLEFLIVFTNVSLVFKGFHGVINILIVSLYKSPFCLTNVIYAFIGFILCLNFIKVSDLRSFIYVCSV